MKKKLVAGLLTGAMMQKKVIRLELNSLQSMVP